MFDSVMRSEFLRANSYARRGKLNDVDRCITKKIIHLNSKFRNNYYKTSGSDFLYNFPMSIKNILSLRIQSIDIPNSWYNFSKKMKNTQFIIKTHDRINISGETKYRENLSWTKTTKIEGKTFVIKIPEGNWSSFELATYLNNTYFYQQSDKKRNDLSFLKLTISDIVFITRFDILYNAPKDFKFDIYFANEDLTVPLTYSAGWTLGFRFAEYKNITGSLVSEGLYDYGGHRFIYISINDFNVNKNDSDLVFLVDSCYDKDILGKVYIIDGKFHITIADSDGKANLKKRFFNGPVNISKLHIKLYDEYGNIIDLNNMDYSIALEFEIQSQKWDY